MNVNLDQIVAALASDAVVEIRSIDVERDRFEQKDGTGQVDTVVEAKVRTITIILDAHDAIATVSP